MTRDLRWNCDTKGCFRQLCPKLGAFDDCFPKGLGMSDVDGVIELGGRFLFLEWKAQGGAVSTGQRIMFQQLTSLSADPHKVTVIVVCGHPREMTIETVQVFQAGKSSAPEPTDFEGLKSRISVWARRAEMHRVRPSQRSTA